MYDAIVVGARCAGASLAMLLARKGYRTLLVDRATFPSDQTMSTHLVWQNGTNRLREWGLLDKVAASNCPPMSSFIIDFGAFALDGEPPPADGHKYAFAPRRFVLDKILVDAAAEAGVEVREGFFVRGLEGDGDRVTGISGTCKTGSTVREAARIVIGADGMNSFVARAVQAQQYNARPRLQGTYFTYWSDVPVDGVEFYVGEWRGAYAMPTNDGMTVVGANWTARDVGDVKADIETNYLQTLEDWAQRRSRNGYAMARAKSAGAAGPFRISSASPMDRAGRWSAMPGSPWTPVRRRASPTLCATPTLSPTPSTKVFPGNNRWTKRSPSSSGGATRRSRRYTN